LLGGDRGNADTRMAQEKPYKLSADIPARPNYRYVYKCHVFGVPNLQA